MFDNIDLTAEQVIQARRWYVQGYNLSTIAQHFDIHPDEMREYLHTESELEQS